MKSPLALLAVLTAAAVACTSAPLAPPTPAAGEDGVLVTEVAGGDLATQGLLPPYPACCPGTECCQPPHYCAYFDTADATLGDTGSTLDPVKGLRLVGASPTAGVGKACKGVNAAAIASPVVLAPVLSYDTAMDYGQNEAAFWEDDNDGWLVDGARRGLGDFLTDGSLSNGLLGIAARQPRWSSRSCGFLGLGTCWDLRCDQASYDAVGAGTYTLASQGGTMLSKYPDPYWDDDFTDMGSGNPLVLAWRTARQRLLNYWNTNKMATLAIVLTAADYAYGCSNTNGLLASEAYAAAFQPAGGLPTIATDVIGFNMDSGMASSFDSVRRHGWGAMTTQWPTNARTYMRNAMTFMRGQEKSMAFFINPPANGEAIDDRSFRFFLTADGVETLLPNAGAQSGCGSSTPGYWLTRPEGPGGRIRINLCPASVGVAASAFTISGRVVYDCVEQYPASATYVRTFDLSRCASSDTTQSSALRFGWEIAHDGDSAVNFRLRFAPRASDLASAPVASSFSSLAWVPASWSTFVDLRNGAVATLPPNYRFARLEMDILSSSDLRRSPTVKNWKLTFTCMDGN